VYAFLLRRLATLLPTLIAISLLAFALGKMAPGDPVELLLRRSGDEQIKDLRQADESYRQTVHVLGLDKPLFYFSLLPLAYPDTLYKIIDPAHRKTLRRLCARYGEWPLVQQYYHSLLRYMAYATQQKGKVWIESAAECRRLSEALLLGSTPGDTRRLLHQLAALHSTRLPDPPERQAIEKAFSRLQQGAKPWKRYIPAFSWYGKDNQYHHWLSACLKGDFGISYRDGRAVGSKVRSALRWTLWLNLFSLALAYLLSIPLGVYMAVYKNRLFDRLSRLSLFVLYALPAFWVGTLLLLFFADPNLGLNWVSFSQAGEYPPDAGFLEKRLSDLRHLILPVACLTYGSLAFIALQMRSAMAEALSQDFVRAARAKGLSENVVIWKHAFRNALFPLITLLGSLLPGMIAGAVVIESIFNLPGMGKLTLESIFSQDWPVVYAVLLLSALLTIGGLLLADILYALADPRVRLGETKTPAT
jgi:peptide/nickel transport system permease protein